MHSMATYMRRRITQDVLKRDGATVVGQMIHQVGAPHAHSPVRMR
jgi:hypothetical protein